MSCSVTYVRTKLIGLNSFSLTAVKVNDIQAYRNMDMTRENITLTFDPRVILLSLQTGFRTGFNRAAVTCVILEHPMETVTT